MDKAGLNGQVAIITGTSRGIGLGLAEALREAGMKLVLTARRMERLGECAIVAGDILEQPAHMRIPVMMILPGEEPM